MKQICQLKSILQKAKLMRPIGLNLGDIISKTQNESVKSAWKDMSERYGVYLIRNKIDDKVYVGSCIRSFRRRAQSHVRCLIKGIHANPKLQNSWNKHGAAAFEFLIIDYCQTPQETKVIEQSRLDSLFGAGCYNIARTTECPMLGRRHSEEARLKMSVASKSRAKEIGELTRARQLGTKHSPCSILRMRKAALERDDTKRQAVLKSPSHRHLISSLMKGRRFEGSVKTSTKRFQNPEYIEKVRQINQTRERPDKEIRRLSLARTQGMSYIFTKSETRYPAASIRQFCSHFKLRRHEIRSLMKGERAQYRGWTVEIQKV